MDASWPQALQWVLQSEGGNSDDPDDSGGRTSRGVTQREYNAYLAIMGLIPGADVYKASDAQIDDIYRKSYWLPYCPNLPFGLDYSFFDENVNTGLHEAVLILQRALGVTADGHIGVVTLAAIKTSDPAAVIDAFALARISVYKQIEQEHPVEEKFNSGWMARVESCRINSQKLYATRGQV
jgi:lysozyme family protein